MEKVLDGQGLSEVWRKIKDRSIPVKGMSQNEYNDLSPEKKEADVLYVVGQSFYYKGAKIGTDTSATNFTTDDTLNMSEDNVLSVATPNKGIISQSEFDALDEEEKNRGVYVIPGDMGGSFNPYFPEIYSEEETVIGRWIDGRPVYRKVSRLIITGGEYIKANLEGMNDLIQIYGIVRRNDGVYYTPINHNNGTNHITCTYRKTDDMFEFSYTNTHINSTVIIISEYTKTTDQGGLI